MSLALPIEDQALVALGRWLQLAGYRFVTTTPTSHARVNARPANRETSTVTGALGWSRRFRRGALSTEVEALLAQAGALLDEEGWLRSAVRFSTLPSRPELYVHSAFPTRERDAVFFGPDTQRFVSLLRRTPLPEGRLVDVGAGTGAGALSLRQRGRELVLADVSARALRYAAINAELAGASVQLVESDLLAEVGGRIDAIVANPPYLVDPRQRRYRDGGGALGFDLAVRLVGQAIPRLAPGGKLVLYTGSPVVDGRHPLLDAVLPLLDQRPCRQTWEELDPDVFGDELEAPAYATVERIAAVALIVEVLP